MPASWGPDTLRTYRIRASAGGLGQTRGSASGAGGAGGRTPQAPAKRSRVSALTTRRRARISEPPGDLEIETHIGGLGRSALSIDPREGRCHIQLAAGPADPDARLTDGLRGKPAVLGGPQRGERVHEETGQRRPRQVPPRRETRGPPLRDRVGGER